ncbi:MAG: hypothetical protein ACK440_11020 [Sphingomonadaceae bacterium]|jgi:hypothetical protein
MAEAKPIAPGWVWMLRAAAVYNLLVALPQLLASATPSSDRIVSLLVGCFGLIYALVSWQPHRFAPMLWAGIIGKLGILVILGPDVLQGRGAPGAAPILAGDLLFTLGFLAFLWRHHRSPSV